MMKEVDVLFNHIHECLLNLDITGLYRDTQREFLNKYNDIDWSDKDIFWDLPVEYNNKCQYLKMGLI